MIVVFQSYPELLFIDATYKLNDLYMPLYVLLCIDGNGESEIVCLWLVQHEDKVTLTKLLLEFKKHNKNWSDIKDSSIIIANVNCCLCSFFYVYDVALQTHTCCTPITAV